MTELEKWKNDFKGYINDLSMPKDDYKGIMEYIDEVPNEKRWIPVSERLPGKFRFVNCTCHSLVDDREDWVVETVYVPQPYNSPYSDWGNIPMLNRCECEVIAWMYRDIPEPYKTSLTRAESEASDEDNN